MSADYKKLIEEAEYISDFCKAYAKQQALLFDKWKLDNKWYPNNYGMYFNDAGVPEDAKFFKPEQVYDMFILAQYAENESLNKP